MSRVIRGRRELARRTYEVGRMQAHELARMIAFAFHDPKQLPTYAPLDAGGGGKPDPAREARAAAKREADLEAVRSFFLRRAVPKRAEP